MSKKQNRWMITLSSVTLCGVIACSESANVDMNMEDPFLDPPVQHTLAITEIQVAGSASTDAFFLGNLDQKSLLLRREGITNQWFKIPVETQGKAVHFVAPSPKDLWVLDDNKGQAPSLVHHYNGSVWTTMSLDTNRICDKAIIPSYKGMTPTVSVLCRTGDSYLQYDGTSKWVTVSIPPPDTNTEVLSVQAAQTLSEEKTYYLVEAKDQKTQKITIHLAQASGSNAYTYAPTPSTERSILSSSLWTFQKNRESFAGVITEDTGTTMFGKAKYYLQTCSYDSKDNKWIWDEMELPSATPRKLVGPTNKEGTDSWLWVEGGELHHLSNGSFASIELPHTADPLQIPFITDIYSDQSNQVWMTRLLNSSTASIHFWNNGTWTSEVFTADRLTNI